MILRHYIVVPQQNPVQRAGGGDEISPVLGQNDLADELVHGRVLDTDKIAAAWLVGSVRAPEVALLVARRLRLAERLYDDVEIELGKPRHVLRAVDGSQADLDAE